MKISHFIYKRGVRVRFRPSSHGVDYGTNRNVQYQLDGLGNRIFMPDSSPLSATESTRTALRYNGFNQLNTKTQFAAPFAVTNFTYDNNGNLLSETTGTQVKGYTWEGFWKKAAALVRSIAGGHTFDNGNKRTAQAVLELLKTRNAVTTGATAAQTRRIIQRGAAGELRDVEEIAKLLKGL